MGTKISIFNPENEIALMRDCGRFTAPPAARAVAEAGAWLPAFYGPENGCFIPNKYACESSKELENWKEELNLKMAWKCREAKDEIKDSEAEFIPWGWSRAIRDELLHMGAHASALPDNETLEKIRNLNHRRTATRLCRNMRRYLSYPVEEAKEAYSVEDAVAEIDRLGGKAIIKLPYSCSGRGIFDTETIPTGRLRPTLEQGIKTRGSVMIERKHDKVLDFAVLIEYRAGKPRIISYSEFITSGGGKYGGNKIAPDEEIKRHIAAYTGKEAIENTERALLKGLADTLGEEYEGILGIDMLVSGKSQGEYCLVPCIEINFRPTMGYVAAKIRDRYVNPESRGIISLLPERPETNSSVFYKGGKISSGEICLTPPASTGPCFVLKVWDNEKG